MASSILIVEDNTLLAMLASQILEDAGYVVLGPVGTTADALAIAEKTKPTLALLNIDLGAGGDGTVLARALHKIYGIRSLFVSGGKDRAGDVSDVALGYVCKPYDPRVLVRSVKIALDLVHGRVPLSRPQGLVLFPPVAA